jgi:hypothetical protein
MSSDIVLGVGAEPSALATDMPADTQEAYIYLFSLNELETMPEEKRLRLQADGKLLRDGDVIVTLFFGSSGVIRAKVCRPVSMQGRDGEGI